MHISVWVAFQNIMTVLLKGKIPNFKDASIAGKMCFGCLFAYHSQIIVGFNLRFLSFETLINLSVA